MAGYNDTRNLIIEALMGRQAGTEIQPEKHQAYALNMLDYVRSVELVSSSTLVGLAEESTVPIQPNQGKVCYIAGVGQDRTVTFSNFIDDEGNPISITTGEMEGVFVILLWNMEHWVAYTFNTNIISSAESANFYYGYNIRKTYASVAAMNADSVNPIGTDGRLIKIGELVTVVNSTTPAENGYYSYEGSENGWLLQSGFSFEIVQTTGTDINKTMSQKAVTDELALKADQTDLVQLEVGKLDREYGYTHFNNETINGDFSNDLTGWLIGSNITDAVVGVDGLTWTAKWTNQGIVNQVRASALLNSKLMYVRFKAKRNSDNGNNTIQSSFGYSSATTHILTEEFKQYSAIIVNNNADSNRITFGTNRTGDELNVTISNVICIDLTKSFQAGNYPSKSTLDSVFLNYEYFNDLEFPSVMNSITGLSLIDDKISKADFFHKVNNETINGDFSNDLTGWLIGSNITDAVVGVDGLTWTAKSWTNGLPNHVLANFVLPDNVYFLAFKAKRNNSNDDNYLSVSMRYASVNQLLISENLEYYYVILSGAETSNIRITFASKEDGLNVTLKDVVCLNLTSIYGENIPDLNQLIHLFGGGYFDTTYVPKFSTGEELLSFMTEENEMWNV